VAAELIQGLVGRLAAQHWEGALTKPSDSSVLEDVSRYTIMSTAVVSQPQTAGWLRSAGFDHFFVMGVLALALLSGAVVVARPELFKLILAADVWLLGYHHVIATYTRLAFDRDSLREHRFFVFYLPFIVIGATFALALSVGVWVIATVYLYWQ
jgi:hypothetical protein